jgi:hypothetical protein
MIYCFLRVVKENYPITLSWGTLRVWTYIFQAESLRFFQYNKLVLSQERINIFIHDILEKISLKNISHYNNYIFMSHIHKLNFILKEITLSTKSVKYGVILPIDITIQNFIGEFRKGIHLIYNDFIINHQSFRLFPNNDFFLGDSYDYVNLKSFELQKFRSVSSTTIRGQMFEYGKMYLLEKKLNNYYFYSYYFKLICFTCYFPNGFITTQITIN